MNIIKTEFMIIGNCHQLSKCSVEQITIGKSSIISSSSVRNLGATLDSNFFLIKLIVAVSKSLFYHCYNIGKIRAFLDLILCATLILAFVTCRLNYCNGLCYGFQVSKLTVTAVLHIS